MTVRRIIALLAPVVLMGAVAVATAPSAAAHASEVGSTPAADEVLAVAPTEVEVQFDSGLLEMGAALVVRSAEEDSIVTGEPIVGENTLTVPVDPAAAPGEYEVAYRVVSADGHTVKGSFTYTVEGVAEAPSAADSAPAESGSTMAGVDEAAASTVPGGTDASSAPWSDQAAGEATDDSSIPMLAIVLGIGLVVILGIGGALLLRR